jgi:hypothetical protein
MTTMPAVDTPSTDSNSWDIERRKDGTLIVRMHSSARNGRPLPDAVFTFRTGDPQYSHWEQQWKNRTKDTK